MTPARADGAVAGARAAERTIAVLDCLASGGAELSLTRLAASVGLPKSTTYRIAEALVRGGLVEHDDTERVYRVALRSAALGHRALVREGLDDVLPHVYALAAHLDRTVELGIADATEVVTVATAKPRSAVSRLVPAPGAASARARAMALVHRALAEGGAGTELVAARAELARVRSQGYAHVREVSAGAFAVPVLAGGRAVGAWGMLAVEDGPDPEHANEAVRIVPMLQQLAAAVGRAVSARPTPG